MLVGRLLRLLVVGSGLLDGACSHDGAGASCALELRFGSDRSALDESFARWVDDVDIRLLRVVLHQTREVQLVREVECRHVLGLRDVLVLSLTVLRQHFAFLDRLWCLHQIDLIIILLPLHHPALLKTFRRHVPGVVLVGVHFRVEGK